MRAGFRAAFHWIVGRLMGRLMGHLMGHLGGRRRLAAVLVLALSLAAAYWLLARQATPPLDLAGRARPAAAGGSVPIASRAVMPTLVFGGVVALCAYYTYLWQAARTVEARIPGTSVTFVETSGSVENVQGLAAGKFDLAFGSQDEYYRAYHGLGAWTGKRFEKLRLLWHFLASPIAYLVRDDGTIADLAGLAGRPFIPGERYSDVERETRRLLPTLGVTPQWVAAGPEETLAALGDRRIVGFAQPLPPGAPDALVLQALRTTRLRALGWSVDQRAALQAAFPDHRLGQIPAGTFQAEWNRQPIPTWTLALGVATTADMSEDMAFFSVKIADEMAEQVARVYPAVEGVDIAKLTIANATTPLHLGAYRYYRQRGLTVPYEITPAEAACWLVCESR